jgi:hypothetical protein
MTAYTWDGSFPSSPSEGDTLIINGTRHEYTSKGSWRKTEFVGQGTIETLAATLGKGNTVYTDGKINFRDAALHISSSTDGQLDIVADTEIQIAAPTVDMNGNLDVSGTALVAGVLTTTSTQVANGGITSGGDIISDTDSTDSLGSTGVRWPLTIGGGTITDTSGAITFGDENLVTTGTLGSGALTATTIAGTTGDFSGNVAITKAGDITTSVFDTTTGVAGSTRTLAEHYVQGKSNSGATVNFQNITYNSADATNGSEDGSQIHYQMLAGTSTAWLTVDGITPTFAGDIALSPADNTPTLNFRHNSNADTYASIVVDTDAGTGGKMVIGTKRNGNTLLTALTIDDDQNATFAGDVNIGGKISNTWTTFTSKLDAEAYSIASIDGTQVDFAQNYYYDGAYKTVVTGYASYIRQAAGVITFRNSTASVTADDAITWAESLSLAAGTGNATFGGKTCFDGTLYSDLYAAGSTIQLGNQFFVSEVAANRADMLLGMTLNAASDFESTGTIKPSGIVLQDGSIILAVDGTTRTVGSAAAATARLTITDTSATFAGRFVTGGGTPQTYDYIYQPTAGVADPTLVILDGVGANVAFFGADAGSYSAAACTLRMGKNNTTGRTINAGGTINASGADFAEYRELIPALYNNTSAGDLLGYNSEGLLTNIFADVTGRFCIKSTSPAYVGNDIWGDEDAIGSLPIKPDQEEGVSDEDYSDLMAQYELDKEAHAIVLEAARIKVDRIAIAGIVPANVDGITIADVGTYLVPISNEDGTIGAVAIDEDNLTLKQYIKSFGAVERIDGDVVMAAVKTC